MTRVLLANHWHDDNRGDSAITEGILTLLHGAVPDAHVTVTTLWEDGPLADGATRHLGAAAGAGATVRPSPAPTELRGYRGARGRGRTALDAARLVARSVPDAVAAVTGAPVPSWRDVVATHDAVVLVGGSNVFDDAGVPAVLGVPRLQAVLGPVQAAVRLGRPALVLGHTLGPFAHAAGRRTARRMLAGADLAVVREARSVDVARSLGVRAVEEAPDLAFALEPVRTPRVGALLDALPWDARRTLVLSVRSHPTRRDADDRLVAEFAAAARALVAAGDLDGVAVVPHTVGPTPVEDDRPLSAALLAALAGVPAVLVPDDLAPGELSAFYGGVGAVVAVRLHAAILALNAGTPTFAVAYLTGKTHGVMAQVGLPDAVGEFTTVTAADVVAGVRAQVHDPDLRARLAAAADGRRAERRERAAGGFAPLRRAVRPGLTV